MCHTAGLWMQSTGVEAAMAAPANAPSVETYAVASASTAPPPSMRHAAGMWMQSTGVDVTMAATAKKPAVPLRPPVAIVKPSVRDIHLAARRAGAEEAARRRQRTASLANACAKPLLRAFLAQWRSRSKFLFTALQLSKSLALDNALLRWCSWVDVEQRESKRSWLRRWRCVLRCRNQRYEREDALTVVTERHALQRVMRRMATRTRLGR